jgi:TetR/AcrR family transcriptional regulator, transcriptional repressor for nem operon
MSNLLSTFDEIINSAKQLIIIGGYNGFSYADIAEVVGIRKASIHHHFPSKVDLVRTLVVRYREEGKLAVAALEANSPNALSTLESYAGNWAQCIEDRSRSFCVCGLLASELPALPPNVAVEVTAFFRYLSTWLTSVFERGAQEGSIILTDTASVEAESFIACIYGAMFSARACGKPEIFATILAPAIRRLSPTSIQEAG